jgi:hypothetical protein
MTTFEARVGYTAESRGHHSIVDFSNSTRELLPLALCTVELKAGEVFKVQGRTETGFFTDLENALWFAVNHNAELKPGAITILTPCQSTDGIPAWTVTQIHKRAVTKA